MNSGDRERRPECNSVALGFQEPKDGRNSGLTVELPSSLRGSDNGDGGFQEDDEPRTPTSSDQRIPAAATCPPAPRKPKTAARVCGGKRKTPSFQRISVDLMVMINAVFAPAAADGGVVAVPDRILAGDLAAAAAGDRGKKVKKANVAAGS